MQSFAYDAHDKLLSGNASGETYSYDANGNRTGLNYYGTLYTFAFDDADRVTGPNGLSDAFLYNGLGQRTAKTDSTGQYALVSDGSTPAAPVLADGVTVYTPGLSSRKNGSSEFRHGDLLGSLRFLTDANQNVVGDRLFSAFGATVASDGDPSTPFGWVGDGESQTDADTGLVLMGHRVYDSRLGRFLSQDPAGDGDNWYAYADNDPIDEADPSGLSSFFDPSKAGMGPGAGPSAWGDYNAGDPGTYDFFSGNTYTHSVTISEALNAAFTSTSGPMMGAGPAGGMFAAGKSPPRDPIDPDGGHGPQGTGNKWEKHSGRRAGQRTNAERGARGYPKDPPGKREMARQAEKQAQQAAKEAARAERSAALEAEQRVAAAETATTAEELEAAEVLVAIDEAAIVVGAIVK